MIAGITSSCPGSLSFSAHLRQNLQRGRAKRTSYFEPAPVPNPADLYQLTLKFYFSHIRIYSSLIAFSKINYDKVGNIYNLIKYYLVGIGKNMYDNKIKISVSVTPEDADFLSELIKTGKAANRSHAVRMAISKLKEDEK